MKKKGNPSRKKSIVLLTVLSVLIAVWSILTFVPFEYGVKDYISVAGGLSAGKDFGDGVYAEAEIKRPQIDGADVSDEEFYNLIQSSLRVMQKRFDTMGYTDATVKLQSKLDGEITKYFLRAEIPTSSSSEKVLKLLLNNGKIEFKYAEGYKDQVIIDNSGLNTKSTTSLFSAQDQSPYIIFILNDSGKEKVTTATTEIAGLSDNNQKTMPIYVGGEVFYSPTLSQALTSYDISMPVSSIEEAKSIEALVKHGALDIDFESFTVKASDSVFGHKAMQNLAIASAVAFVVFVALIIILYKGLGLITAITSLVYILFYVLALTFVPGVIFSIFSVGAFVASLFMFIIASVNINERVMEEYKLGKTPKLAIAEGHKRSFLPIIDLHLIVFIASLLILILTNSKVFGFALVLAVGVFLSAVFAIVFNKLFLVIFSRITSKASFFGFKKVEEEKESKLASFDYNIAKFRKTIYVISSAIIIAGIVLNAIFGFNANYDINKNHEAVTVVIGHEESINPEKSENKFDFVASKLKAIIKDYATSKNLSIAFSDIRFTGTDSSSALYLEYKFNNDITIADKLAYNEEIEKAITDNLKTILLENGISNDLLNNFNVTTSHSASYNKIALPALYAMLIFVGVMFIYMLIRFKFTIALSAIITVTHNILLLLAIITIFRLPISMGMIAGLFATAVISYMAIFILADKLRENFARKSLQNEDYKFIISKSIKDVIKPLIKFMTIVLLVAVSFIVVGFTGFKLFAVVLALVAIIGVYASIFLFNILIGEFKECNLRRFNNKKVVSDK